MSLVKNAVNILLTFTVSVVTVFKILDKRVTLVDTISHVYPV